MTNTPERIWLTSFVKEEYGARLGRGQVSDLDHSPNPDYPEYIRADLMEELLVAAVDPALFDHPSVQMFDHAKSSGYKRPVYRAEGLKISLAAATGANAGALYVKTEQDEYIGKVSDGRFFGTREATEEHKQALATIAENPRDAAIRYGQRTGSCACCGRTLSNHASIELGIGPICANRWGFM